MAGILGGTDIKLEIDYLNFKTGEIIMEFKGKGEHNIYELEKMCQDYKDKISKLKSDNGEMLGMLNKIHGLLSSRILPTETDCKVYSNAIEQLIKEATTI